MEVLEVIKMGNPRLREVCAVVSEAEIKTNQFQRFIDNMIATQRAENGAGIAASQVNILQRVFTMEMEENPRYPNKETFPLYVAINPIIKPISNTIVDSWEGCLSIPGIRGQLPRFKSIKLSALDRYAKPYEIELDGFAAIVAQHELDHLNGILLIDRIEDMQTLTFQKEYEKYWM
jgi:peptide deformylase